MTRTKLRGLAGVVAMISICASSILALSPAPAADAAAKVPRAVYSAGGHSALTSTRALGTVTSKRSVWTTSPGRKGAWVRWSVAVPVRVDSMRIATTASKLEMVRGVVRFSDGSRITVRPAGRNDLTLKFKARTVRSAVLTVTEARGPRSRVALRRWTVTPGTAVAKRTAPAVHAPATTGSAPAQTSASAASDASSTSSQSGSPLPAAALPPPVGKTSEIADEDPSASVSVSVSDPTVTTSSGSSPELTDARDQIPTTTGGFWTAAASGAQDVTLTWPGPVRLDALQLYGSPVAEGAASSASASFDDGSVVRLLPVPAGAGAPATVAFTPRTVHALTIRLVPKTSAPIRLREIAAFSPGQIAPVLTSTSTSTSTSTRAAAAPSSCAGAATGATSALRLVCPLTGATLATTATIVVSGPEGAAVRASSLLATGRSAVIGSGTVAHGTASIAVDTRQLPTGPVSIRLTASGVAKPLTAQFVAAAGVAAAVQAPDSAAGRSLVFDDEFSAPLSISGTGLGAAYAATKPASWGNSEFGDAVFSDPATHPENLSSAAGYLRIRTTPLAVGETDPNGWGRTSRGGILSSASVNGGFAAQHAYFEIRMLAPASPGTWPAFWMMSDGFLENSETAANSEVDAVELYGQDSSYSCHSWHDWIGVAQQQAGSVECPNTLSDWSDSFHTYGVDVSATATRYYIDGRLVRTAPAVANAADPFYFMVDLSLGGGWPIDLSGVGGVTDLYVDYVRVYV